MWIDEAYRIHLSTMEALILYARLHAICERLVHYEMWLYGADVYNAFHAAYDFHFPMSVAKPEGDYEGGVLWEPSMMVSTASCR